MAQKCRQITGSLVSCAGWIGLIIATATNDWVRTCDYSITACVRMDELGSRGLWAECVISPALYHCVALNQILILPVYMQTARALMICACLIGFPALALVMVAMPCVMLANNDPSAKQHRALIGGVLILIMAICGIISTVWFPIGAHQDERLMSFGGSLYAGWVGSAFCLLGGFMILCCRGQGSNGPQSGDSFHYSGQRGSASPMLSSTGGSHAKSVNV